MMLRSVGFILIAGFSFSAFAQSSSVSTIAGLEFEFIGTYDTARLDHILGPELDEFMKSSTLPKEFKGKFPKAKYPVKLYRVKYLSRVQ